MTDIKKVTEASVLLLENEQGEFLIQNRASISKAGELWGFFGGGAEPGESPEDCIVREIKEELDIDLEAPVYLGCTNSYSPVLKRHIIRHIFYATTNQKAEEFRVLEGDFATYKSLDEIENLEGFMWKNDAFQVIRALYNAYITPKQ